jgi:predicted DNA-binding transcriptional regulator AlpA
VRILREEKIRVTLDELARDPVKATLLSPDEAMRLLACCSTAQSILLGRLMAANGHQPVSTEPEPDRFLTPEEAAESLGVTPTWLYRHAKSLPFTKRISRKVLRFSEAGLRRWQANRRA